MELILNGWPTIALIFGSIILGFVALYGLFDKQLKDRNKEKDGLEDRIRSLYKEESAAQEEKITNLTQKVDELQKKLEKISIENRIMKDLIQGKDQMTQEFQKQGFEAIKQSATILAQVQKNGEYMKSCNENIVRLATAIEKHLSVTETTTTVEKKEVKVKTPKQ